MLISLKKKKIKIANLKIFPLLDCVAKKNMYAPP